MKLIADSGNGKVAKGAGVVATTYAPIAQTCPKSCVLRGSGCYAQAGRVRLVNDRLEREAEGRTPESIARAEATQIDAAFPLGVPQDGARGGRDLRLHVSGDARTARAAAIVGAAAARWRARGGGHVWTYTHAWRRVPRSAWGPGVSPLASIEDARDGRAAVRRGYAPALVVGAFPRESSAFHAAGVRWIPCPEQTRRIACNRCRLCFDDGALRARGAGIAFAAHSGRLARQLPVVRDA